MKIEWGKKVCCPACSLAFYDLGKASLVCPYCGNTFEAAELLYKKAMSTHIDEIDIDDKAIGLSGFEFENEVDPTDIQDSDLDDDIDNLKIPDIE